MFDIKALLRPHLLTLKPYSSARDEYGGQEGLFLDANENPFGTPGITEAFNRYPDPYQIELKKAIAKVKGIAQNKIFLGNGSDEPIDLLIRSFCQPAVDKILILPPTYGMYEVSAHINQVTLLEVSLTADYQINLPAVLAAIDAHTKMLFICSPNNPTGNLMNRASILELINQFKGLVVIDEAYIDFASEESLLSELDAHPNLVVLQTFSKAWGMAGLRLGMAFASEAIIHILNQVKAPYNINSLTQKSALKILEYAEGKNQWVREILENKEILTKNLEKLDLVEKVFPSDANFLLVKVKDAPSVFHYLIQEKVIVRDRSRVQLCDNSLRITVGTPEENFILIQTLKDFSDSLTDNGNQ